MRFTLIDRILQLREGESITAVKGLSLAEDYLKDHFPRFPVMPGVLMLEAMFQASAWLVRKTENFAHSMVVLREARNVRYADFVAPGQLLTVTSEIIKQEEPLTTLKAQGVVGDTVAVSARLVLEKFDLAQRYPSRAATDDYTRREMRRLFTLLYQPTASLETVS